MMHGSNKPLKKQSDQELGRTHRAATAQFDSSGGDRTAKRWLEKVVEEQVRRNGKRGDAYYSDPAAWFNQ